MKNSFPSKYLTNWIFWLTIICWSHLCLSACSNSTSDIISSYDSKFPVKYDPNDERFEPGINDIGFEESKMLDDEYFKSSVGTLQLRGPKDASVYEWTLYIQKTVVDPEYGTIAYPKELVTLPAECFQNGSSPRTEYYIVYIPLSGLKPGSYVINLRARNKGGTWYSDKAAVIIYDIIRNDP